MGTVRNASAALRLTGALAIAFALAIVAAEAQQAPPAAGTSGVAAAQPAAAAPAAAARASTAVPPALPAAQTSPPIRRPLDHIRRKTLIAVAAIAAAITAWILISRASRTAGGG